MPKPSEIVPSNHNKHMSNLSPSHQSMTELQDTAMSKLQDTAMSKMTGGAMSKLFTPLSTVDANLIIILKDAGDYTEILLKLAMVAALMAFLCSAFAANMKNHHEGQREMKKIDQHRENKEKEMSAVKEAWRTKLSELRSSETQRVGAVGDSAETQRQRRFLKSKV